MNDQRNDGMEPNEAGKFKYAKEGSPDEPNAPDAEGHMPRYYATEPSPDEPGAADAEGHGLKGKYAKEPSPDEPSMEPDEAVRIKY